MSGSGSRRWIPSTPKESCDTLAFRTALNSPQPNVLGNLRVGEVLDVALSALPHQRVNVLKSGTIVGTLTGHAVPALIRCLQNGYGFEAQVSEIKGGDCKVLVRPR